MNPTVPQPANISVTLPVSQAFDRVKRLLFQPFDLGKWLVIGFCAWLAMLGQGGGGSVPNFDIPSRRHETEGIRQGLEEAWRFVLHNLYWILPLVAIGVLVGLVLWVLFTWLSSRGQFMFLHCVALDKAEVLIPWHRYAPQGSSLCAFQIGFGLIGTLLTLPLVLVVGLLILGMVRHGAANPIAILAVVGAGLGLLTAALIWALIEKLTLDFVVPIMFLRRSRCLAAWREFLALARPHFWQFVLYLLFQIVLSMVISFVVLAVVLITCCCAGCLMALPYVGTVALLPVLVFKRAYTLHYLAQYGPAYDSFPAAGPLSPATSAAAA